MCWLFQAEGEEDGGTVDDGVPFHQASGASLCEPIRGNSLGLPAVWST